MRNDFNKMGLNRRSSLSLSSSISPVEEVMDDVDEIVNDDALSQTTEGSNGSSSTIEEAISAVDMGGSNQFNEFVCSPTKASFSVDSGDVGTDPNALLVVNLAGAYLPSPELATNIPILEADIFEAAFDVSFKKENREPKVRLRRSKSMPVPYAKGTKNAESTPGKGISCDCFHTQTPLRRDVPKIFSGQESCADWGVSEEACEESIRRLKSLIYHPRSLSTGSLNNPSLFHCTKSPVPVRLPTACNLNGSLLSPPNSSTPYDILPKCPVSFSNTGSSPLISATFSSFKYMSPLINNLICSPMSAILPSIGRRLEHGADHEGISEESVTNARRALQLSARQSSSPDSKKAISDAELSMVADIDRRRARCLKSRAKWRRVSIALNSTNLDSSYGDTSISPAPLPKCNRGPKRRLSLSADGSMMEPSIIENEDDLTVVNHFNLNQRIGITREQLGSHNFRGVVIGGTYQSSFERGMPVVAPPSTAEKRVTGVRITDQGLELDIYFAKLKEVNVLKLGRYWCLVRASPDGYLVSRRTQMTSKFVCYYLPQDPFEWIKRISSPKRIDFFTDVFIENAASDSQDMECDDGLPFPGTRGSSFEIPMEFTTDMTDAVEQSLNTSLPTIPAPMEADRTNTADWNNPVIIALALNFLVDTRQSKSGRRKIGLNVLLSSLNQLHLCRLVSKSWAIGYYRIVARTLSDSNTPPISQHDRWSSFIRQFEWGKFLASGACKEVYCVQKKDNLRLEAISIMDLVDLRDRDMELAVSQEVEVSLMCCTLFDLKICPNFVRIYSVFRSAFGVPEELWRSSVPLGSLMNPQTRHQQYFIPRPSHMRRGSYQYIRMDFCEGGDLENFVRKHGQLLIPTVASMLFQMFFAVYTCREKLQLRHFDIKLLNFFVTHGSSLLPLREAKVRKTVTIRIGFGEKIFHIPTCTDGFDLLKLADFGTSVIGSGTLGDPIGANQFTTLENTPIEYLILGSEARQAYSADTFCLGLCFFHLLTGTQFVTLVDNLNDCRT